MNILTLNAAEEKRGLFARFNDWVYHNFPENQSDMVIRKSKETLKGNTISKLNGVWRDEEVRFENLTQTFLMKINEGKVDLHVRTTMDADLPLCEDYFVSPKSNPHGNLAYQYPLLSQSWENVPINVNEKGEYTFEVKNQRQKKDSRYPIKMGDKIIFTLPQNARGMEWRINTEKQYPNGDPFTINRTWLYRVKNVIKIYENFHGYLYIYKDLESKKLKDGIVSGFNGLNVFSRTEFPELTSNVPKMTSFKNEQGDTIIRPCYQLKKGKGWVCNKKYRDGYHNLFEIVSDDDVNYDHLINDEINVNGQSTNDSDDSYDEKLNNNKVLKEEDSDYAVNNDKSINDEINVNNYDMGKLDESFIVDYNYNDGGIKLNDYAVNNDKSINDEINVNYQKL